jgi:hypothetical protein
VKKFKDNSSLNLPYLCDLFVVEGVKV